MSQHEAREERVEERLDDQRERLESMEELLERIAELDELERRPASIRTIVLTAERPVFRDDVGEGQEAMSIGVINPSAATIYLGVGGSARAGARVPEVPPRTAIVLPVAAEDLELGADVADLDVAAVVQLLRFPTPQPFFSGPA